ncbi:2-(3-amino-3-carboxypropyl)histidine synthase subunit 2 [Selaginella moellendorffii]|uniref:2-(3-amino-3-carboxypropyl)histidine synthase subunit 2 n=1 Tax=Selaginella moellendorffii TaxID=88036 RepID=UPI000D1C363B|nr:2-(3-amino-3-carboxypropyl)histidine synthase subunit 2 [Selaginella moellendorffii]|eukprot:XP_024523798.1 2-(3-amino-3-carboxypropyl)histidine synthase subunit 2 [Selaginella moellendorffii]
MPQPVLLKRSDFRWNFPKEIVVAYPIHPSQHLPGKRNAFLRSLEYCGLRSSEYAAGAIRNVKKMVKSARKKSYTLAVGKPNPAKLANIPEFFDLENWELRQYWRKKTHNFTRSTLRRETRLSYGCNL